MIIRYEYNSTCCNHYYIEVRSEDMDPIHTQCNVCNQGEYTLTAETVLEDLSVE